jgi:hypothetical protein
MAMAISALAAIGALLLMGCTSINGTISSAMGKQTTPTPAPVQQNTPAPVVAPTQQNQPATNQSTAPSSGGTSMAYQYQFNAFYSGVWSMGWFGYKEENYKPGQGTIWKMTNMGRNSSQPMTLERALLKVNADSSQWWRLKLDTDKKSILYEFLVGPDSIVTKVRYKDPSSGAVSEFVPSQSNSMPSVAPSNMPQSRADMEKYKVDRQTITVQAGSFETDHYLYTDDTAEGSAESWMSDTVPGYIVKSVYTNKKSNQTATGELMQIESGLASVLGSY